MSQTRDHKTYILNHWTTVGTSLRHLKYTFIQVTFEIHISTCLKPHGFTVLQCMSFILKYKLISEYTYKMNSNSEIR